MKVKRREFFSFLAAACAAPVVVASVKPVRIASPLTVVNLPIGYIIPWNDASNGLSYKILCDGGFWLPCSKPYGARYLSCKRFPVLFGLIGFRYGKRLGGWEDPSFELPNLSGDLTKLGNRSKISESFTPGYLVSRQPTL